MICGLRQNKPNNSAIRYRISVIRYKNNNILPLYGFTKPVLDVLDCEIRSAVSSPGNSYLDLIRDYASSKQLDNDMQSQRNEDCEQRSSPELKIVCGDSTEQDDPQGEVVSLPTFTTSHDHLHRDDDKVLIITDSNCQNRCSPEPNFVDNKDPMTATSDLYKDVLTLVNSDFTLNIEDTTDIDTKVVVFGSMCLY